MDTKFADTSNIKLKEGTLFADSMAVGLKYVKSVDVDKLLAPSYEMHGLPAPNNAERYGGWERKSASNWGSSPESFTLAGHSLGHWMSAAAVFYNDTRDEELLKKLTYAINKLDELQTSTGSSYIGGCPEDTFTKCFNGVSKWHDGYWVPWYGIHKIYQGLADSYLYADRKTSETAFKVLKKFSDWAVDGTAGLSDSFLQEVLNVEYGGMNEIFALMYKFTGEEKYLTAARRFTHDSILNPLIAGTDSLSGLHANTQIPKIVGAAELYEQAPDKYADYRTACENFWSFVINNRSYAIGGNSISEHFETEGMETLGIKTCESCNTYNMMRLTEHLFSWEHKSEYMDWYEQALYNHILGQQDPETGEKMYFVSLLQGHHRVYEVKDKSWWCCTGTGMENPSRYTRTTYYEDGNNLYINLYMPTDYTWTAKNISFKQETDYPYSDKVKLTVTDGSAEAVIKLRVPTWCEGMQATVNGQIYYHDGNGYISLERLWNTGDIIEVVIPMSVRTYRSRTDGQIAYQYGPITLAAALGSTDGVSGVQENITDETRIDSVTADVPYIITNGEEPQTLVETIDRSKLTFKIGGENMSDSKDIILQPFHEIHHQFYTVYFNADKEMNAFEKALNDVTTDRVEPDGQQDELGHGLKTNTSGSVHRGSFAYGGKSFMYRDAWGTVDSGADELPYFAYTLSVAEGTNYLCVVTRGYDNNITHTIDFNIIVDGEVIGEIAADNNNPGEPVYNFTEIPSSLTDGKTEVRVKLRAKTTSSCACMLEMRTTTKAIEQ